MPIGACSRVGKTSWLILKSPQLPAPAPTRKQALIGSSQLPPSAAFRRRGGGASATHRPPAQLIDDVACLLSAQKSAAGRTAGRLLAGTSLSCAAQRIRQPKKKGETRLLDMAESQALRSPPDSTGVGRRQRMQRQAQHGQAGLARDAAHPSRFVTWDGDVHSNGSPTSSTARHVRLTLPRTPSWHVAFQQAGASQAVAPLPPMTC